VWAVSASFWPMLSHFGQSWCEIRQFLMTESAGTVQGVVWGVGGIEHVQSQFLMTESAGTAQGVDVALP